MIVVIEMVVLGHFSGAVNLNKIDKIPEYVGQFRKEWLFIRGINKECKRFLNRVDEHRLLKYSEVPNYNEFDIFSLSQSKKLVYYFKRFIKCIERDRLQDTSNFELKEEDVIFIDNLENDLDDFVDSFCEPYIGKINKEKYDNDDSGFREFYESFVEFKDKIKVEEIKHYYTSSDKSSENDEFLALADSDSDH